MTFLALLFFSGFLHAAEPPSGPDAERAAVLQRVQAISQQIDNYLVRLEPYRNAAVWSQGFIDIMKQYPFVDFYMLEGRLRKLNSNAFLIAAPTEFAPQDMCARALFGIPEGNLKYFLWVSVNGRSEMQSQLEKFKIQNEEINLENLKKTGLLTSCK